MEALALLLELNLNTCYENYEVSKQFELCNRCNFETQYIFLGLLSSLVNIFYQAVKLNSWVAQQMF